MNESHFLNLCKAAVEEKLNWPPSKDWRQRDYVNLISLIEKESGINLSLSTIKRIWKVDYTGTPQPATLDALAKFIGYQDWLDFKTHQALNPKQSERVTSTPSRNKKTHFLLVAILALVFLALFWFKGIDRAASAHDGVKFSTKNSSLFHVPNTVIFHYELDGVEGDSFFIQQSWNRFRREKISKEDSVLTSTYYYPGAHKASLIANEEIIAQSDLKILTMNWIALSRKDMVDPAPLYLAIDTVAADGKLKVRPNELKLPIPNPKLMLSYYYVKEFEGLDQQAYRVKLALKNDSLPKLACPQISIMLLGTEDMHFIPLSTPGCIGNLGLKIASKIIDGKRADLSVFGTDIFSWHEIEFQRDKNHYEIRLDGQVIYSLDVAAEIGELIGINVNFSGNGSLDYVELGNPQASSPIYREDF